jgi:prepilin-type N-terminal cleavage/methylation domain-containing protein
MKHISSTVFSGESNAGYTIIEVLIALAIFSIGLMAMGALQASSLLRTRNIAEKTEAWTIIDDQVHLLKSMPFYANDNDLDDDGDGDTDELTEEMPDLVAGAHNENRLDGRYTVHWQVVNDQPIPAVVIPPPTPADPVLPEVPAGTYTVSKTIAVQVTLAGENPATDALADVSFVKTWAENGIP